MFVRLGVINCSSTCTYYTWAEPTFVKNRGSMTFGPKMCDLHHLHVVIFVLGHVDVPLGHPTPCNRLGLTESTEDLRMKVREPRLSKRQARSLAVCDSPR